MLRYIAFIWQALLSNKCIQYPCNLKWLALSVFSQQHTMVKVTLLS